jgi:hypothetical protein
MVLARTLDCVRGVRFSAKDRLFVKREDKHEETGACGGRQVGGTVGGESHQVRDVLRLWMRVCRVVPQVKTRCEPRAWRTDGACSAGGGARGGVAAWSGHIHRAGCGDA